MFSYNYMKLGHPIQVRQRCVGPACVAVISWHSSDNFIGAEEMGSLDIGADKVR